MTVDGLRETDEGYVVRATAGGYEGQFTINRYDTGWRIDEARADGGPSDLAGWVRDWNRSAANALVAGRVEATMATMAEAARTAGVYRVDNGEYPERFNAGNDGWGAALMYSRIDRSYELRSAGPDGVPRTGDDIVMVNGQFTRIPGAR